MVTALWLIIRSFLTISISLHLHFRDLKHHPQRDVFEAENACIHHDTVCVAISRNLDSLAFSGDCFRAPFHVILTHYVKGARNLVLGVRGHFTHFCEIRLATHARLGHACIPNRPAREFTSTAHTFLYNI